MFLEPTKGVSYDIVTSYLSSPFPFEHGEIMYL